jgi:hypothetical protein
VLTLQRTVGNTAVVSLLQRDTDKMPKMKPRFGFVTGSLKQKEWAAKSRLEQYADVAHLAGADAIASVGGLDASAVNQISEVKVGGAVKPGLNLADKYGYDATAGFVDDQGQWQGDILPATKSGPEPKVALIMGPQAFQHDESYALGSLRHEMEHARHMELSIQYMLKWRDDGAKKAFSQWVAEQQKRGRIPPEVAPLIRVEHDSARGDTELLAYLEGFVTTVQYLPDKPGFDVMKSGQFPHAIAQLQSLGSPKNAGWADKVRSSGLNRVHEVCCKGLDEAGRKKLLAWLDALIDPSLFGKPADHDEELTLKLIQNEFGSGTAVKGEKESRAALKQLLEDMRTTAKQPCK